jgi:RNA polymerase sigma factor (sigma-70 family)
VLCPEKNRLPWSTPPLHDTILLVQTSPKRLALLIEEHREHVFPAEDLLRASCLLLWPPELLEHFARQGAFGAAESRFSQAARRVFWRLKARTKTTSAEELTVPPEGLVARDPYAPIEEALDLESLLRRAGLSPREEQVVRGRLEELTLEEIAARLGVKVGTVAQLSARAKRKIRSTIRSPVS